MTKKRRSRKEMLRDQQSHYDGLEHKMDPAALERFRQPPYKVESVAEYVKRKCGGDANGQGMSQTIPTK